MNIGGQMWPSKTATEEQNIPKAKYDPPYYVHIAGS